MKILAIETSCDETAAAVVENGRTVHSSVVLSQVEEHKLYGGVVPEIASRRHVEGIYPVVNAALWRAGLTLKDIDAVAVTAAPGLIGALLVGVNLAKGLSMAENLPLIPVHHIRAHVAANYIAHSQLEPPFLCLIVSGGHSHIVAVDSYTDYRILGRTRDDAAGEAFDKVARTLGYPYPGGIHIDHAATAGDANRFAFPKPKTTNPFDFSFSGLKTSVINLVHNAHQKGEELPKEDIAASFQKTVCEVLVDRFFAAAKSESCKKLVIAGGVAANSGLRNLLEKRAGEEGFELYMPPISLCGDNAAMVGAQAYFELLAENTADLSLNAAATMPIDRSFQPEE
ncbi:MAG: tRNA (adenosine(37)-N6)-threonylcarbamoyltransferase complex transferase subunit TsaD [Oscillospiraceae bacterium]